MKKLVAFLLASFLLVACSDQQELPTESRAISAETYVQLDLMAKLYNLSKKNEQIMEEANIEEVQAYLRELGERERTDTPTEETRTP